MQRIGPNTILDETTWNSPNYTPAASVPAVYGMARTITGITIHHWGVEGQAYENVGNFLSRAGGNTSAHFVVESGRAACLISPEHAAWHTGSAVGNATTIGIECRPEMSEGDFQSLVELVVWLESVYGEMKIYGHKDWSATACPGKYYNRLGELIERVNAAKAGASAPAPVAPKPAAPATTGSAMTYTVVRGDTLSAIAQRMYGSASAESIHRIASASGVADPSRIEVGQELKIPGVTAHTVVPGDTVSGIALKFYGAAGPAEVRRIAEYNRLANPSRIEVGQVLGIPGV